MTPLLFDIASEKGPLASVSPETDRAVKPVAYSVASRV